MNARIFRFRIWSKYYNRWIDESLVHLGAINIWNYSDNGCVVQQYTGLKDKNGKEIYEGDIIKGNHDFGPAGFVETTVTVSWDNEVGYQWNYWDLSTIEVIGNIYENKQ